MNVKSSKERGEAIKKAVADGVELDEIERGTPMVYNSIETQVKFLQGKVLTVIDACLPMGEQKNAIKQLINQKFSEQLDHVYNITRIDLETLKEFGSVGVIAASNSGKESPIKV